MSIQKEPWGKTPEGAEVDLYTLSNANGLRLKIMTYGATITAVEDARSPRQDRERHPASRFAGGLPQGAPFFGSTVGRYANRIAKGKFTLDGKQYTLATNNGPNHLHGGIKGFDKASGRPSRSEARIAVGVELTYFSPDGEEGYPGNARRPRVIYSLTNDNELTDGLHGHHRQAHGRSTSPTTPTGTWPRPRQGRRPRTR